MIKTNVFFDFTDFQGGLVVSNSDGTPAGSALQTYPEGSTQRLFLRLKSHPTHNVTVTASLLLPVSSTGGAIGTLVTLVGPTQVVITPSTWNASHGKTPNNTV
jgi:hypothetical protein